MGQTAFVLHTFVLVFAFLKTLFKVKPSALLNCRFPVVAMGVLKWVDWTVSEPRYFQLQTDHTPVHLALLDEVGASGPFATRGKPPSQVAIGSGAGAVCREGATAGGVTSLRPRSRPSA